MRLFYYKRVLGRIWLEILGIKIHFVIPAPKKNYYISLGTNCFSRRVLTQYGIKPKKKQGELSCPFDLCTTPIDSITKLLENDFNGFCDELVLTTYSEYFKQYDKDYKMWVNKKYSILFPHDGMLDKEELKARYNTRIENFKYISKNSKYLEYVMTVYNRNFSVEILNRIFNSLCELRNGKDFKFIILSFVDNTSPVKNIEELNFNISYQEIKTKDIKEFGAKWTEPGYISENILKNIADIISK